MLADPLKGVDPAVVEALLRKAHARPPVAPSSGSVPAPDWSKFIMPPIRRASTPVFSMRDLVSVQPMTAPSGNIFFMDLEQEKYVLARGWTSVRPGAVVVGTKGDKVTRFIVVSVGEAGATLAGSDRRLITVPVDSIGHEPLPGKCEIEMECEVIP